MNRSAWLLQGLVPASRILEIGASYSPIAPKAAGWQTHVVDHARQQELREKYAANVFGTGAIEPVDSVWRGGPLHEAIPTELAGGFDAIIASHVVEHLPDLVGFLASAERLLKPSGAIALALPDQRYCFDFFKPLTTTGDVLQAHAAARTQHSLRTLWNQVAYSVRMAGKEAWGQEPLHDLSFTDSFSAAANVVAAFSDAPAAPYVDSHVWQFTPSRFRLVILELGQLALADWRIEVLEAPWGAEFLCRLRRGAERIADAAVLQARRMALLLNSLGEAREQIDSALGAAPPERTPDPVGTDGVGPDWGALPMLRNSR